MTSLKALFPRFGNLLTFRWLTLPPVVAPQIAGPLSLLSGPRFGKNGRNNSNGWKLFLPDVVVDAHGAKLLAAHGAVALLDVEFLTRRHGLLAEAARTFRVEAQVELVFPGKRGPPNCRSRWSLLFLLKKARSQ